LAAAIEAAEQELAAAYLTLRQVAVAILHCGDATMAEVSDASGLGRAELLELAAPPHPHRGRADKESQLAPGAIGGGKPAAALAPGEPATDDRDAPSLLPDPLRLGTER
jgi:hypothetical protein